MKRVAYCSRGAWGRLRSGERWLRPLLLALSLEGLAACQGPCRKAAAPPAVASARPVHWSYEGEDGPASWRNLSPEYAICGTGRMQSPVDLESRAAQESRRVRFDYQPTSLRIAHHEHVTDIIDNGHTIQISVEEGSVLTTGRAVYSLKQFHFHTPSEHSIDGKHWPMEAHFVHQSSDGRFAVVAVLFEEGVENPNLATLIRNFPARKGDASHFPDTKLDLALHLPSDNLAYAYMGSFTTPPCPEDVEWFVFQEKTRASRAQLDAFSERLSHNNRPVQERYGRAYDTVRVAAGTAP